MPELLHALVGDRQEYREIAGRQVQFGQGGEGVDRQPPRLLIRDAREPPGLPCLQDQAVEVVVAGLEPVVDPVLVNLGR